jgi:polysaccharide pyruvyl transferase WcaK-like protein
MGTGTAREVAGDSGAVVHVGTPAQGEAIPSVRTRLRAAGRCAPLVVPFRRRVAYVGWLGRSNMGDEAMFAALHRAFSGLRFVQPPSQRAFQVIDAMTPHRLLDGVMLGGGTLVGWPGHRWTLSRMIELTDCPAVTVGVGVEDPDFLERDTRLSQSIAEAQRRLGASATSAGGRAPLERELERWASLLAGFHRVSVRGPRSQEILRTAGVHAEVVGDPALLLADSRPREDVADRLLGLNVGVTRATWGEPSRVFDAVETFAASMLRRGWRIRFLPVWPNDVPAIEAIAGRLGSRVEVFEDFLKLEKLMGAIRQCRIFVGQKLHSVVLASGVYVPSVMLEYQPKCRDFQRSIGREEFTIRADVVDSLKLTRMVQDLDDGYVEHRAAVVAGVATLRARLRGEVEAIERILGKREDRGAGPRGW